MTSLYFGHDTATSTSTSFTYATSTATGDIVLVASGTAPYTTTSIEAKALAVERHRLCDRIIGMAIIDAYAMTLVERRR